MSKFYSKTENRKKFFASQMELQQGRCAICGRKERLVIDHDHDSGFMRGLLCYKHNCALGMFEDNPKFLKAAIDYLYSIPLQELGKELKEIHKTTERLLDNLKYPSDRARARELAELYGISEATAQSRISRARKQRKKAGKAKMPQNPDSSCDSCINPLESTTYS